MRRHQTIASITVCQLRVHSCPIRLVPLWLESTQCENGRLCQQTHDKHFIRTIPVLNLEQCTYNYDSSTKTIDFRH